MHAGQFPHLGPSLVLALGKGCALLSLPTSAAAVPRMPREAVVVTVDCSALFREPWRVGRAAGTASYVLQAKRRLPGHLKVFLDLTPEVSISIRLPAPSFVESKLRVLTGSGYTLFPWLHSGLACSQQVISSRCLQL